MSGRKIDGGAGDRTSAARRRRFAAIGIAVAIMAMLAGCVPVAKHAAAHVTRTQSPEAPGHTSPTPTSTSTSTPTPTPTIPVESAPNPAISHPASPGPVNTQVPSPTLTSIPRGTVVAQGDVASPKGSIHFHFEMVANGENAYFAQYSGFTSTLSVPVSVTLIDVAPRVGDGLTYHGIGDHQLGGPTTGVAPSTSAVLRAVGQPSYLGTLVTYSSAPSAAGVPIELGPNKILAVTSVNWAIPIRQSNVHPVDSGKHSYASGTVTSTTASGAPKRYLVAPGDITSVVAQRFGISIPDLIWLNVNLEVFGDQQYLYEATTLNLDPNSL
jgi:hypothetical protein